MKKPLITFITTIYNTEVTFLKELFESFGNLLDSDLLEFIVIDDCSTFRDGYLYLEKKYLEKKNFVFHSLSTNTRRTGAFIKGISESKGKYLHSLDSDDLVIEEQLKFLLDFLKDSNADLYWLSNYYRDVANDNLYLHETFLGLQMNRIDFDLKDNFRFGPCFSAYNTLVKGDVARKIKYNENIVAPHDDSYFGQLWVSNSKNVNYLRIPFFIYNYNQPTQTFSGSKSVPKSKVQNHTFMVKEILHLVNHDNKATYLNALSILHTHFGILTNVSYLKLVYFKLLIFKITDKNFRQSPLWKNSWICKDLKILNLISALFRSK